MSKILSIDDMIDAADELELKGRGPLIKAIEQAGTKLAKAIAKQLDIKVTSNCIAEGKAFAGTCASFGPKHPDQECPKVIDEGDEGGEWE